MVQWCLDTPLLGGGYSGFQLVFGSNPVDPFGRGDRVEDLLFAQDTSLSDQFAQQRKQRMMA